MTNEPNIALEPEQARAIRVALIVGLAALGEIERLENNQEGEDIPEHLRVIHPTDDAGTVAKFAEALTYVQG